MGWICYKFYHLLTGIIPIQTNYALEWRSIEVESIEKVRGLMFDYKRKAVVMNELYCVHGLMPEIVSVIISFLVQELPEDGDVDELENILDGGDYDREDLLVAIYEM